MVYVLPDMRAKNGSLIGIREAAAPRRNMARAFLHRPSSLVVPKSCLFRRFRTPDF